MIHISRKAIGLGALLLCTAATVAALVALDKPEVKSTTVSEHANAITHSTDNPGEKKPVHYTWKGSELDPKKIDLPTLGIEGYIQKVSVDQNQQMAAPNNVHLAGWFVKSVQPGQLGLSIIDGHVDGKTTEGIFKKLDQLKTGDQYAIELGNGKQLQYKVGNVTNISVTEAANLLYSQEPGIKSQLNLITCGGSFDSKTGYSQRVIVTSELLEQD
jgi:LPXTG-site transpeptidase (sortase) family protein